MGFTYDYMFLYKYILIKYLLFRGNMDVLSFLFQPYFGYSMVT